MGFAVSRQEDYRGLRLGWILDVFADAGDHDAKDALLGAVLDRFRAAGIARAQAFAMNAALQDDLARRGFRAAASPMQFCVRTRVSEAPLADRGRWANQEVAFVRQLWNMLELARVITLGALRRDESRGAHYKPEFPKRDDQNWLVTTKARWTSDGPAFTYTPVDASLIPPRPRKYDVADAR